MTARADVIRMAREAGFEVHERKQQARVGMDALCGIDSTEKLERFAELAQAAERERWAKVAEQSVNCLNLAVALRSNKVDL